MWESLSRDIDPTVEGGVDPQDPKETQHPKDPQETKDPQDLADSRTSADQLDGGTRS